jgi:hypothetical protein
MLIFNLTHGSNSLIFRSRISGSHNVDYEEYYRLECNAANPDKFAVVSEERTASIIRVEE